MTIKTDKVIVESGADFTFVCRKIPFAISCSEIYHGDTNLIDLDLVNKMKIPVRNIKVTRMSLLGHDVRAVGRIKQTVQCVVNGQVQGCVHLEGKVVRDLFSLVNVDCLASSRTYERLMGKKPPDIYDDEGYDSTGDIPTLGGKEDEEIDKEEKGETEDSIAKDDQKNEDPPDPPDAKPPGNDQPIPSLQIIKSDNPNLCVVEIESAKSSNIGNDAPAHNSNVYEHFEKFGPGPRDLLEFQLNSISMNDEEEETDFHCDLCFHEGKPLKIVTNHDNRCPTCPSMTPAQKVRMFGLCWKDQAKVIIETRYRKEKARRR